jgi:hypothetical protein
MSTELPVTLFNYTTPEDLHPLTQYYTYLALDHDALFVAGGQGGIALCNSQGEVLQYPDMGEGSGGPWRCVPWGEGGW